MRVCARLAPFYLLTNGLGQAYALTNAFHVFLRFFDTNSRIESTLTLNKKTIILKIAFRRKSLILSIEIFIQNIKQV